MAEPTLSLTYDDLAAEVGFFLGVERESVGWTPTQRANVDSVIQAGLRQFYSPPPIRQEKSSHVWSFMRPATTISTVAGTYLYTAPADFGGLVDSTMQFAANQSLRLTPIRVVSPEQIDQNRQLVTTGVYPELVAIQPLVGEDLTNSGLSQFAFWPTPSDVRVITYRYFRLVGKLATGQYAVGSNPVHSDTILQSCYAVASNRPGIKATQIKLQNDLWMQRLETSINMDRKMFGAKGLGKNNDASGLEYRTLPVRRISVSIASEEP